MSFAASASWPAVTVTVCAVPQLPVVNVRLDEDTVTSGLSELMLTVTCPVGCVFSFTVYVPVLLPSLTVSDVRRDG